jgi:daunorubicin resistance ABC transporter ATP-binding subunit
MMSPMSDLAIEVEGLTKRYKDVEALAGIDLTVPAGTVFGLLGPNGAGKTTAVRILSTILRPDGGTARVLGYDVVRQAGEVRKRIGLAGQNAAVDPNLTGGENLRLIGRLTHLPKREVRSRAGELLTQFDLEDAADRPVRTYSGGMRRRLDLAAALVHRPPVLFFDEPTTGLDPQSRADLWDMIRRLVADGASIVLTTQYLDEADRLADRIAVVDHGQVVANDTPGQLKARLGSTVIELGMADDGAADRARAVLASLDGQQPGGDGATVRVATQSGAATLVAMLRELDADGLEPATVAVREPSMDDVFLSLVGRHAEEETAA